MSNFLIAFLFAAGAGGWIFSQAQKHNGGLTQNSLIIAVFGAIIAFIVMLTVLLIIFD